MKSQFHAICTAAADAIRSQLLTAGAVPVVAYERGDTESEIERGVNVLGLCVIVLPFEPVHSIPGTNPPFYDEADLVIHVAENPTLNTTGIDGTFARDAVVSALCGNNLGGLLADFLSEHRIARADEGALTIREITFKAAAQLHE